jgi:hypothetical protein
VNQSSAPNDGQAVREAGETTERRETFDDHHVEDVVSMCTLLRDTELTDAAEHVYDGAVRRYDVADEIGDADVVFREITQTPHSILGFLVTTPVFVVDGCVPALSDGADPTYHVCITTETFESCSWDVFAAIVRHELCHAIEREQTGTVYGENAPQFIDLCRQLDATHGEIVNDISERAEEERTYPSIVEKTARDEWVSTNRLLRSCQQS